MSAPASPFRLSKSKIAAFEHCPRRLWLQVHRREAGQHDADTLARFKLGHAVGKRATDLVPGGIMVTPTLDVAAALEETAAVLAQGPVQPIFEAAFMYENVFVRVDILEPDGAGGWRLIEVKASTRVRTYQLADVATQLWVAQGCGLPVSRAVLRHIEPPFSFAQPRLEELRFRDQDVTGRVGRFLADRTRVATIARAAVDGAEVRCATGPHCQRPFACEFQRYCRRAEELPLLGELQPPAEL